ncbi:DUF2508 family protein [Companilactobacillus halodurans]|uniref:DUF2508 family protein n=1 Tax=Companilactobacillus halodurans TaxID=2584183 RepID=A0A5P0ZNF8_9LACO|nr:DUF2508 family protein [Companilactobacillus halodurans]MQS75757.1 DUF2508 family protein [Companilactobacillus halodurans]MQS98067.1 DUF2508 family protein [Companilactobacillus halodurans]
MFGRKKVSVQKMEDDRLLDNIHIIQTRISNRKRMINNSVDVDETTRIKMKLDQLKYQYLYLEARRRKAKAKATTNIIFGDEDTFLKQPSRAEKHW